MLFESAIKDEFMLKLRAGEHLPCPCCERYAQVYKRGIHQNLVHFMRTLNAAPTDDEGFVDVPELLRRFRAARDFCVLKYWGLLEQKQNPNTHTRTSGRYRLTARARSFLKGEQTLPKYALVFDDRVLEFSKEHVSISDVMQEKFDYSELVA